MMQCVVLRCVMAAALLQATTGLQAQTTPLPAGTSEPTVDAPASAATLLSQAETAIALGQYDKALPLLNKAIEREPAGSLDDARIFYDRGYVEQARHQLDAAETYYRKAIVIDPKQFESHAALGRVLAEQQRWKDARRELELAAKLQPASGDARQAIASVARTLARVDAEMRDPAAASDALLAAIKLTGEQPDDTLLAGQLAEEEGNYPGAEQEYRKLLATDATSIPAAEGLGRALIHEGKFAEAESALHPALLREPNDPTLLAQSATALAGAGNTQAAIAQLQTLHRQNPNQPAIARMLADLLSGAGEADKAEPLYQQLLADDGNDSDLLTAVGENFTREQQWGPAIEAFQKSLQIQPTQEDAWTGLAFAAWKNAEYPLVLTALDRRAQTLSDGPETLFMRATSLDHLHRTKEAIEYYRKFLAVAHDQYPDQQAQTRQRLIALQR